jgi:hypothetical protein
VISVPQGDANASMREKGSSPPAEREDAPVSGTDYNATTTIDCGFKGAAPTAQCDAGVKREWNGPDTAAVEVTKPDRTKRAIFLKGTTAFSADGSQAGVSAAYEFKATRKGDETTVHFGPETHVILDALVMGG